MTDPTDPAAYEWPAIDLDQHIDAVASTAKLFAENIRVIRYHDDPRAGYCFPMRFIAGIDQTEDDVDPEFVSVKWGEPVTLTLDLTHVAEETIALLFGLDVRVPLCEHEIPAEGQE